MRAHATRIDKSLLSGGLIEKLQLKKITYHVTFLQLASSISLFLLIPRLKNIDYFSMR